MHPHGDSACYEAMVLMAQPFSTVIRWLMVRGTGARRTIRNRSRQRVTPIPVVEIFRAAIERAGQGTAHSVPNFDGTLQSSRKCCLPVCNTSLNGTTGIAVGIHHIPPHNLAISGSGGNCINLR
ncbi:DNA gyrase subunit A [Escherichia coli]